MALIDIAVAGMVVTVDQTTVVPPTPPPPPPPPVIPSGVVATIVVAPPTGVKCFAGSLMHRHGDQITVTAITVPAAGATTPDPGPYTVPLNATVTKVFAEGVKTLVLGDLSNTINATPKIPGAPPVDYPVSFKCVISSAGQAKVSAQ